RDFAVRSKSGESHKSKCGSELARECAVSGNVDLIDPPPSRASPLPQGFAVCSKSSVAHKSSVGASLLAKAQCQALLI
ncbi:hypothetical protein, partial [Pseudomonas atacamensis]|uniref:hypothetical protein n=1 Tax=Pseudomonas atacamensis TaxID=2565368 RepID=UPI002448C3C6